MLVAKPWQVLAMLIAFSFLVILFVLLKPVLMPFVVALLIAYLANPLICRSEKKRLSRPLAVALFFLLISLLCSVVLLLLVPALFEQIGIFISHIPQVLQRLQASVLPFVQQKTGLSIAQLPLSDIQNMLSAHWQQAGHVMSSVLTTLSHSTKSALTVIVNLALIPVILFYFLRDWPLLISRIQQLLPGQQRTRIERLALECDEVLSAFIRGQLLVMLALGLIYWIGLSIAGLKLALFLGLLAGLFSIVPYLGFFVGIAAAFVAAFMQFHAFTPFIYVTIVFLVGQLAESFVLTPLLVGDKIGLHPVAVIFAIMAGGQLAGFMGVLLALPVAAVLMVFVRHVLLHYQNSALYLSE